MEIVDYPNYLIFRNGAVLNKTTKLFLKGGMINDYKRIQLIKNKNKKVFQIHRLIALHFIPNPFNYKIVDHIDRNKLNNHIDNLRWVSSSMNGHNRNVPINNKYGIKNINLDDCGWRYFKCFNGKKFTYRNKNKQIVLWVKFVDSLLIKRVLKI